MKVGISRTVRTILGVLLLIASHGRAQLLPVANFASDDGLSHPQIWSIFQDSRGYVWIGTTDGINRYDGTTFSTFSAEDGLRNVTVRTIIEDSKGDLWFGTDADVVRYDGRSFEIFDESKGLGRGTIWAATRDRAGRLWFGTQYGGVSVLEGDRFRTFSKDKGLAGEYVYALLADSKGNLWVGHRGAGVTRCTITKQGLEGCRVFTVADGLAGMDVRAIVEDRLGNLYFGTRGQGVSLFDGQKFTTFGAEHGISDPDIYALAINELQELVIGTLTGGLTTCDLPAFRTCRTYNMTNGLPDDAVRALAIDRDHSLWIGFQTGLTRLSTEPLASFTLRDGLPHHTIYSLLDDLQGGMWIGTLGGLARISPSPDPRRPFHVDSFPNVGMPGLQIWSMLRDNRGRVWIAADGGLCEFEPLRGCVRVLKEADGLASDGLISLHEMKSGDLAVTSSVGVSILHFTAGQERPSIRNLTVADGLVGSVVYSVEEDRQGRLWIGSDEGLSCLDGERIHGFKESIGLPVGEVFALHLDPKGTMWVGTNGVGVLSFEPPSVLGAELPRMTRFGSEHRMPLSIADIAPADDGMLWIGSTEGVTLFDPAAARSGRAGVRQQIDRDTGLIGNEVNAFATDRDGQLWIGAVGGVSRYDPHTPREKPQPPLVTIERLRTATGATWRSAFTEPSAKRQPDASWITDQALVLTSEMTSLRIDFRGLSFRDKGRLRYQVQLVGFDPGWTGESRETFKEYTNLDPGSYTFRVRAATRTSGWGAPAELRIAIPPVWWRTLWFIGLVALLSLVTLFIAFRAKTYRMQMRNAELELAVAERTDDLRRYARALEEHARAVERANARIREADRVKSEFLANMSHELRTPLNSIIGFSDVLVPRLDQRVEPRENRFLRNIQSSGRYLLLLINNLLDLSKIEAGRMELFLERVPLGDVVENTCNVVQGYASDRNIEVITHIDPAMPNVVVDVPKFKQILLNLLSNAVKFSSPGDKVEVEVHPVPASNSSLGTESYELSVIDHGPGIREEDRELIFHEFRQAGGGSAHPGGTGLGLALVKRFVTLLGGRVGLESTTGQGSTFRVLLPIEAREESENDERLMTVGGYQPRILLVEPERDAFGPLASTLEREGFLPVRAHDVAEALRIAKEIDPAVIVFGLSLPAMDAWKTFTALESQSDLAGLTLSVCLFLKGQLILAFAADACLLQPVDSEAFVEVVLSFVATEEQGSILLVASQLESLAPLMRQLTAAGFRTAFAEGGAQAVDLAAADPPSAIVVDLMAPGLAGFDAVHKLQHDRRTRHLPIVLLADRELVIAEGRSALARNSWEGTSYQQLALTMHELLRRRSARAVRVAATSLIGRIENRE